MLATFNQDQFYLELDRLFQTGDAAAIEDFLVQQANLAKESGDHAGIIAVNNELGGIWRAQGKYDEARYLYEQILSMMIDAGLQDSVHYATALLNTGDVYLAQEDYVSADRYFDQAEQLYRDLGYAEAYPMAALYNNQSVAARQQGRYAQARQLLVQALAIIEQVPEAAAEVGTSLLNIGQLDLLTGNLAEAKTQLEQALARYAALPQGRDIHQGQAFHALAQVYDQLGDYSQAQAYTQKALEALARDFGSNHPAYKDLEAFQQQIAEKAGEGK
ncbi:tetratricopeptide repeat protein [Peptococcus simiae]|uniref:Tetratricopeptide repeat protein n=1 Tax=Peptococcus simiae TaxID=1643805 RepID=A0ABW9H0V7_9FIRM